MPGRIGTVSGLFFGFAFGMGALGAAVLGQLADRFGLEAPSTRSAPSCLLIGLADRLPAQPGAAAPCRSMRPAAVPLRCNVLGGRLQSCSQHAR